MSKILAPLLVLVFVVGCWGTNLYKFTQCDFESSYKCEAVHGVGLVPVVSMFTVWFGTD